MQIQVYNYVFFAVYLFQSGDDVLTLVVTGLQFF